VLSAKDMADLTDYLRGNEDPVWRSDREIAECFLRISECFCTEDVGRKISRIAVSINELLLHLLELFRGQHVPLQSSLTTAHRSVSILLDALRANSGELWTLEDMADKCGMGVTSFVKYCRKITNQTPIQYLNELRIERAAEMLATDAGKSITDIAFECGFSSSQYFATVFKRRFHCSPREYRKG
jgi:AraC-like DNA-binding protein